MRPVLFICHLVRWVPRHWFALLTLTSLMVFGEKPAVVHFYRGNYGAIFNTPVAPSRDGQHVPFRLLQRVLKQLGIGYKYMLPKNPPAYVPEGERVVYFDVPVAVNKRWAQSEKPQDVLFLWEPAALLPGNFARPWVHSSFSRTYTLCDDLVDNARYFKFYEFQPFFFQLSDTPRFARRKLCTMLSGNKKVLFPRELYSERRGFARFSSLMDAGDLDYHGFILPFENWGWVRFEEDGDIKKMHLGKVDIKIECYKNYKFGIVYENSRGRPEYLTAEKLLFPMVARCVPVYWGADNIEEYIPPGCFIDRRDFTSNEELYRFMKAFSEEDYERFLESVDSYMDSDRHLIFAPENLVDIIMNAIYPEYPRHDVFNPDELERLYGAKKIMQTLGHLPPD